MNSNNRVWFLCSQGKIRPLPFCFKRIFSIEEGRTLAYSTTIVSRNLGFCCRAMPQFSFKELAIIRKLAGDGNPPVDIQKNLAKARVQVTKRQMKRKTNVKGLGPDLTSVRRVLKGYTHCQGKPEARGRKKKLSKANVGRYTTLAVD